MRATSAAVFALILAILVGLPGVTSARDPAYKVIVHPKNGAAAISRDFLRNAFLKKEVTWGGGETLRPIDLSSKFAVRERFVRDVLKKTPAQLKAYWSQQVFSGKGVPPPEVSSAEDVIAYVLANRGAVGYIPADVDPAGAKVIEVK